MGECRRLELRLDSVISSVDAAELCAKGLAREGGYGEDQVDRLIHHSTPADKFVTMFYAALDADKHELHYSNAGHNPPFLIPKEGEPKLLESGGPVLGVLPNFEFDESTVNLEVGDLLVIYTDGFSEAINPAMEEFGEDRLLEIARGLGDQSAQQILETLSEEVRIFCGAEPQFDDMTIMVLRRTS
jgi:sigma-B regulation protein RsbU (phosphoserine phosphatase)